MRVRFRSEDDEWTPDGRKITDADNLRSIQRVLEDDGPIIVEHWFYRGACAPERLVFDDFDRLMDYLNEKAFAGDAIHVWSFASVCTDRNSVAWGKCPDDDGLVPMRGAY